MLRIKVNPTIDGESNFISRNVRNGARSSQSFCNKLLADLCEPLRALRETI
jgi:hypothetical protein